MNPLILDKSLNSMYQYIHCATDNGEAFTPDTSILFSLYNENADTFVTGYDGVTMTVKDSITGVYQCPINLSALTLGSYTPYIKAVDDGDDYKALPKIIICDGGLVGFDRNIDDTIEITCSFPGSDGIAVAPGTSIKISIYPANSDTATVDEAAMSVKDTETGNYKYAFDISAIDKGVYNYIIVAVHSGKNYIMNGVIPINYTSALTADDRIKFFDTNLIESATLSEPSLDTFGASTDIIENIRDNHSGTYITLNPAWADTNVEEPDGDMDDNTTWTGDTNLSLSDNAVTYLVGAKSVEVDGYATATADTDIELDVTGSEFDITDKEYGMVAVYFTTAPTDVVSVSMTIADSSANDVVSTVTVDKDGVAFGIGSTAGWQYLIFDLSGDGSIDYTDIQTVTIKLTLGTAKTLDNVLWDGLRFVSNVLNFQYQFTSATDCKLIELKDTTSARYNFEKSADAVTWTNIKASTSLTDDYGLYFDDTGHSSIYYRVRVGLTNQSGTIGVQVGDILLLDYLDNGMLDLSDNNVSPSIENNMQSDDNWIGKKFISKNSKTFACNIDFDGFSSTASAGQTDADFVKVLFNRTSPFYIWLNGGRLDSAFEPSREVWQEENLYLVHDVSASPEGFKTTYLNGGSVPYTIELIESAWIEED